MSGSGGDAGYDYQAQATAFVATYALTGQPLDWFDDATDVPARLLAESGGAGDDLQIKTTSGATIEVQAKHGLSKDERFWTAIVKLCKGLNLDCQLRGVLLVDSSTSGTIRTDLRLDLMRGGRTDNRSPIMHDVSDKLRAEGIEATSVLSRLRIVVKDFGLGADGRAVALTTLRQILVHPDEAATVFCLLTDEGHKLIKHRGQRDARSLASLVSRHTELQADDGTPAIAFRKYCTLLETLTERFEVPALGVSLSIDEAFINLRVIKDEKDRRLNKEAFEKAIREYREWERLAADSPIIDSWDVDTLSSFANQCVVIGGPGSGKTTLSLRLAHILARRGRLVLRVRLKLLLRKLESGDSMEQALASFAKDVMAMDDKLATQLVHQLEFLIGDGLDECDPMRSDVAEHLRQWNHAHSQCRMIVTTRPVGHHPAVLPGFDHVELLPLSDGDVRRHSRRLFSVAAIDEKEADNRCDAFLAAIDEDKAKGKRSMRTLATRSPLLLGFLVRLAIDDQGNVENRAQLFDQILRLMESSPNQISSVDPRIDSQIAQQALDVLAFTIIDDPASDVNKLPNRISIARGQLDSNDGTNPAIESIISYWERRRVLEKLTAGHLAAIAFVHPALGEFAASRFIVSMPQVGFEKWFSTICREPQWYQPIVLASCADRDDRILKNLLALDDPMDMQSNESITAAAAIAEGAGFNEASRTNVIESLLKRLSSPIPLVCIESALALLPIASFAAELIRNATATLREHSQEWTKFSARALYIACCPSDEDLEWFENWFSTFNLHCRGPMARLSQPGSVDMPDETVDLQHRVVELGVGLMIARRPAEYIESFFKDKRRNGGLSVQMIADIAGILRDAQFDALANALADYDSSIANFESMQHITKQEWDFLSGCMLIANDVSAPSTPAVNLDRFFLPAMIYAALDIGNSKASDARYFRQHVEKEAVVEVMRGTIAALEINQEELANEVAALRALLREDEFFSSWTVIPRVLANPEWSRASSIGLKASLLEAGVRHPHRSIAITATKILAAGAARDELKTIVENLLRDGKGRALHFASYLAKIAHGKNVVDQLWARLRAGITHGCESVAHTLILSVPANRRDELLADAMKWLLFPGSRFAGGVARALVLYHS